MNRDILDTLQKAGLVLVNIPPINQQPTKGPTSPGWNKPYSEQNRNGYGRPLIDNSLFNYGLLHSASKTIAFDLDNLEVCRELFNDVAGLDIDLILNDSGRFEIKSPKQNRGKLIFKLPDNVVINTVKKLNRDKESIFELRGGDNQDVIVGTHPEGGEYKIFGDPENIPVCPDVLLNMALNWDDWRPVLDSFFSPVVAEIKKESKKPKIEGQIDAIKEFNASHDIRDILTRAGYKPVGKRYIRPNSSSGSPGIRFYNDYPDGIERIISTGGDDLANEHAHHAFDCYKILECGGDFKKAIRWSESINQHNDKVFNESIRSQQPEQEKIERPAQWLNADELAENAKAPNFLINNIIESKTHGLIAGSSQSFKSFCVLKMAHSICTGHDFFGYDVFTTGKVLYICGEGMGALERRIKALRSVNGGFDGNFFVLNRPLFIDNIAEMEWLKNSIKEIKPVFVIFDTFSSLATSTKENVNEEVARTLRMVSDSCVESGSSSIVVHHYGKDAEKGTRGASAFGANVDYEISMSRTINTLNAIMSCKKSKDGDYFKDIEITAHIVDIGLVRQDGGSSTSLVLKSSGGDGSLTPRQLTALEAIKEVVKEHGHWVNGMIGVTERQIKDSFNIVFAHEGSKKYGIFGKVMPYLKKKGEVTESNGFFFINNELT